MTASEAHHFIDIGQDGRQVRINLHGAQLWHWRDRDGADLLWSGDPQVWSGRAPILFPIVGSVADNVYRYHGKSYPLGRHGFARNEAFSIVEQDGASALLRLAANDESLKIYPFRFQLDLRFTCTATGLDVAVSVRNLGDEPMPFSFGFHPALRWPLEPDTDRSGHAIVFAEAEPAPICKLDSHGLILPQREPSPVAGRQLDLRDELFAADALIFADLASRSVTYGPQDRPGRHIRVDFENLPMLGVWTKPGAGYICIEPWQGIADPEGFDGDIFEKPGILALDPAETWQARLTLSPEMAA